MEVRSPPCGTCSRLRDAALPSLHGVQEDVFPRFSGTMECSDSLPPISPGFVAFTEAIPPCASWFAPSDRDARSRASGSWSSGSRAGNDGGNGRVSQVPGQPCCPYALLLDPGRIEDARPSRRLDMAPACVNNEGSRDGRFRGSITRPRDWLSTLRSEDHSTPRKTRFRLLGQAWPGGIGYPQGCN